MGSLAEPLRERMVGMAVVRAYAPGESIYLQDDPPFGLAIVLDGTVRLTRTSLSGRETLVHVGQTGFWFGELAVLLDCPTQVAATARERAVLLVFPAAPLQRLLSAEPEHYAPLARSALEHYALLLNQLEQHRRTGAAATDRNQAADPGGNRPYGARYDTTAIQPASKANSRRWFRYRARP